MAAMTIEQMRARLTLYLTAEEKILQGQEYMIADRRLRRADLAEVRSEISALEAKINAAERANGTRRRSLWYGRPC